MKFKNKKTGVVIDVPSRLGGAWEPVEEEPKKAEPAPAPAKPKKSTKKKG